MPAAERETRVDDVWGSGDLRHLRGFQGDRQDRVIAAARRLAADGGYDAVTMNRVATLAEVSRASLYQHFWSKDHILVTALHDCPELNAEPSDEVMAEKDLKARVHMFLEEQMDVGDEHRNLVNALVLARLRAPRQVSEDAPERFGDRLSRVLGDELPVRQRDEVSRALQYIYGALLLGTVNGNLDRNVVDGELEMAIRLVLGDDR